MNIDIFTCLAPNSSPYADALRKNMTELACGDNHLRFHAMVAANDSAAMVLPDGFRIVITETRLMPPYVDKPSVRHAKLLDTIIHHIPDDSGIIAIVDCDMLFLSRKWDYIVSKTLRTVDCVGTEKHDGSLRMFFMAMPSDVYRGLRPDYTPGIDDRYESEWTMWRDGQGNPRKVVADTGWKIEKKLIDSGLTHKKLTLIGDKYYFPLKDHAMLFCAHMGGSHKKQFSSHSVKQWYRNCKRLIY